MHFKNEHGVGKAYIISEIYCIYTVYDYIGIFFFILIQKLAT